MHIDFPQCLVALKMDGLYYHVRYNCVKFTLKHPFIFENLLDIFLVVHLFVFCCALVLYCLCHYCIIIIKMSKIFVGFVH